MESRTTAQNLRVHQFGNCKPQFAWAGEEPGTARHKPFCALRYQPLQFPPAPLFTLMSRWLGACHPIQYIPAFQACGEGKRCAVASSPVLHWFEFHFGPLHHPDDFKLWIDWNCWQLSDYFPICSPFLFLIDPEIAVILLKTRFLHFAPPVMSPFAPLWMSTLFRLPRVTVQSDQKRHRNRAVDSTD